MRAHGRGGSLLVVPPDSDWRESIVQPMPYSVSPTFPELADLMRRARVRVDRGRGARRSIARWIRSPD